MRRNRLKAGLLGRSLVIGGLIGGMLYVGGRLYVGSVSTSSAWAVYLALVLVLLLVLPRIGNRGRRNQE